MNHQYKQDAILEFLNYEFQTEILSRELTESEEARLNEWLDENY
jgi:hypothetical protein